MDLLDFNPQPTIQTIQIVGRTSFDVLRLDLIDPIISGNKWYKLKYNLLKVMEENRKHPEVHCKLLTFGGAFSNHIHATAAAGSHFQITTIGIIRGEEPQHWSHTLRDAQRMGMQLEFITRSAYAEKDTDDFKSWLYEQYGHVHIVPEGGSNYLGINGCMDILNGLQLDSYDAIVCAMGTGTTVAGLLLSTPEHIQLYGIPVLKNGAFLKGEVQKQLNYFLIDEEAVSETMQRFSLFDEYHFGGYGHFNDELLAYIDLMHLEHGLPLDRVYTAKAIHAIEHQELANKRVLFIHTGGLQGNRDIIPKTV